MTTRKYTSRSQQTTLTSAVSSGATLIPVASATTLLGGATISAGQTMTVVIDPDTSLEEIVDITSVSGNNLTVTRAVDMSGAAAQDHSAGAVIRHMIIGRDLRESNLHIEATTAYNDGTSTHTLHGLGATDGSVVGTDATQTLTNKTLTSPVINNPTITGSYLGDAGIVFEGATADAYETTLNVVDPTADRTISLPDATGTVVRTNSAQTLTNKTIDMTGVTLTGLSSAGMVSSSATPKNYVDSILGSATAAATSAASAATSASSAATSASSAATSATSAANSATAASTSASSAAASATAAASSATAAATSASSAATSATAAASSATTAANSVATISTYATSAANSASAAATSATSAAASATAAATSATSASASASAAATSATSAAASATAAATSATSAANSATAAASSAADAAATLANAVVKTTFDAKGDLLAGTGNDTYTKVTAGTDGYILTADSTSTAGIKWAAAPAGYLAPTIGTTTITSGTTVSTITSVTLNNSTLTGTLTAGATSGTSGQLLTSTGSGVQWAAAPVSLPTQTGNTGKVLTTDGTTASWSGAAPVAQISEPTTLIDGLVWVDTDGTAPTTVVTRWSKSGLAAGTTAISGNDDNSLPLSYTPGYEMVYLNGALLSRGNDYTATSGTSLTLTTGIVSGDLVEVICPLQISTTDTYTQTQANSAFPLNTSTFYAGKNKVINGDFGVWQRGTSFTTPAALAYNADRYYSYYDGAGSAFTISQQTFSPGTAPVAGYEGTYYLRYNVTTAGSGSTVRNMGQKVEDVRVLAGQNATFSFWAKADSARNVTVSINQSFGSGGSADVNTSAGTASLTTSWQRFTFTIALPSIAGKTIGTNSFMYPAISLPINTTFTFDTWGWQLEAGSVATAFVPAGGGSQQAELALCQRYYWRNTASVNSATMATGIANSTTNFYGVVQFPVTMRTTPSSVEYSTLQIYDANTVYAVTNLTINSAITNNQQWGGDVTVASGLTTTRYGVVRAASSSTAYLAFNAEL